MMVSEEKREKLSSIVVARQHNIKKLYSKLNGVYRERGVNRRELLLKAFSVWHGMAWPTCNHQKQ